MQNLNLLVLFFIVTLSGCCFDCGNNHDGPTYLMDDDFKDFVYFPTGSYWVYTDATGKTDSVYQFNQNREINDQQKIYPFNFETFLQNFSSSFYKDTLLGGAVATKNYDTILFIYTERYISNLSVTGLQFFDKKKPGSVFKFAEDSSVKYDELLSSYTVNGVHYVDVKVFENLIAGDANMPRKIYYARGIGIIKKELFGGRVWSLKQFRIN